MNLAKSVQKILDYIPVCTDGTLESSTLENFANVLFSIGVGDPTDQLDFHDGSFLYVKDDKTRQLVECVKKIANE